MVGYLSQFSINNLIGWFVLRRVISLGRRYYEVELLTPGMVRIGWCTRNAPAASIIGMSGSSYAFAPEQASLQPRGGSTKYPLLDSELSAAQ